MKQKKKTPMLLLLCAAIAAIYGLMTYFACSADDEFESNYEMETLAEGDLRNDILENGWPIGYGKHIHAGNCTISNLTLDHGVKTDIVIHWTDGYTGSEAQNRSVISFEIMPPLDYPGYTDSQEWDYSSGVGYYGWFRYVFSFTNIQGEWAYPEMMKVRLRYAVYKYKYSNHDSNSIYYPQISITNHDTNQHNFGHNYGYGLWYSLTDLGATVYPN